MKIHRVEIGHPEMIVEEEEKKEAIEYRCNRKFFCSEIVMEIDREREKRKQDLVFSVKLKIDKTVNYKVLIPEELWV